MGHSDHLYFHHSSQNVNVAKRGVNFRFGLIMLRISVWTCVLVPLLDRYYGCVVAFIAVNIRSAHAGRSCVYLQIKIEKTFQQLPVLV